MLSSLNQLRFTEEIHIDDHDETGLIEENLVWGIGILVSLCLLILSVILTSGILFIQSKLKGKDKCLKTIIVSLICLAIGSILGDVVIHILPQIFGGGHGHTDQSDGEEEVSEESKINSLISSLLILIGFLVCFIAEKIIISCTNHEHDHGIDEDDSDETKDHDHNNCIHTNNVIIVTEMKQIIEVDDEKKKKEEKEIDKAVVEVLDKDNKEKNPENIEKIEAINKPHEALDSDRSKEGEKAGFKEKKEENQIQTKKSDDKGTNDIKNKDKINLGCCEKISLKGTKAVGLLTNFASLLHNLIDGIAIGVVFAHREEATIISTIIAIFLHEIPKEISDAGILIHAKYHPCGILFWNVINNVTGIVGTLIGLGLGTINEEATAYCLAFVAGNFFYISLSEMVPLVLRLKRPINIFLTFFMMILGFVIMFVIAIVEEISEEEH